MVIPHYCAVPPELLSAKDAAAKLGVSVETIRRWAKDQKISHVVLPSGHRRYRVADLDAVLDPTSGSAA